MFDGALFALLSACSVVAIAIAMPGHVKRLLSGRTDIKVPIPLVMAGAVVQQSLFAVGLTAAGVAVAPQTGLAAPWFAAVAHGEGWAWGVAAAQLPAALLVGGASVAVFLLLYYQVLGPRMPAQGFTRTEESRVAMGLLGRVLMGGIAEEVMFRWGVMSVVAWLAVSVIGMPFGAGMWTAIVVAGLLFALGHLPGVVAAGLKLSPFILVAVITLNMVVSLACGWLFWKHGLLAAVIAHALLHAVWHPVERSRVLRRS